MTCSPICARPFSREDHEEELMTVGIAVEPKTGRFESLEAAVRDGGATVVPVAEARAIVWADPAAADRLPAVLASAPQIEWVALPYAGIEPYLPYLDHDRTWTCAKGVYARPVAEHALMLGLTGLRGMSTYARATSWAAPEGHNLLNARVTILGGGGITKELVALLKPFDCEITVVRRSPTAFEGAGRTLPLNQRLEALDRSELVVLALALTPETEGVMSTAEFEAMADHGWLVNVARGGHVDDDALLTAVRAGTIGGAALDVTSPEPLPDGHPLWGEPRVLITPHIGNTPEMGIPLLAAHIVDNVARFVGNQQLVGLVDTRAGY
ncbi:MAG: phosphoglycerate dehydrogenase-like enzyme [Acidimicrobiales bacterium]|jgi:phosphoglycerate dehydrogenase-like enzyme